MGLVDMQRQAGLAAGALRIGAGALARLLGQQLQALALRRGAGLGLQARLGGQAPQAAVLSTHLCMPLHGPCPKALCSRPLVLGC